MAAPHLPESGRVRLDSERTCSPFEGHRHVEASVRVCLSQSPYSELRGLNGDFHEGILTLRGRVSSFYMKQVAQTLVKRVDGVERIVNRVEVTGPAPLW